MKSAHDVIVVPISSVSTPSVVITSTPKWLLDAHVEESKKNKNRISESIPVVIDNSKYVAVDRFDWLETALHLKQDTIPVVILDSTYSPLATHIRNTEKARVNPIRKARAIITITNDMPKAQSGVSVLNISSYYVHLMGDYDVDSKAARALESLIDTAISVGVVSNEPPLKFFEEYFKISDYEKAISILDDYLKSANKANFIWLSDMISGSFTQKNPRSVGKKTSVLEKFDCKCGEQYVVDDGDVKKISNEIEGFGIATDANSKPMMVLPPDVVSYLNLPSDAVPVIMNFSSGNTLAKKLGGKKQRFVVFAAPDSESNSSVTTKKGNA